MLWFAPRRTAKKHEDHFPPKLKKNRERNMYIDDCSTSVSTEEELKSMIYDISFLFYKVDEYQLGSTTNYSLRRSCERHRMLIALLNEPRAYIGSWEISYLCTDQESTINNT